MNIRYLTAACFLFLFPLCLFAQNKTIYFDSNWESTSRSNAEFYRIAYYNSSGDFTGTVKDFYGSGKVQCIVQTDSYRLYCGQWPTDCGMKNGTATWYHENGNKEREMRVEDGQSIGMREWSRYGTLTAAVGCTYGDCNNGYGVFYTSNGDLYSGNFAYGDFHGSGKYTWASSGKSYSGQFRYGQIHKTTSSGSGITAEDVKNGLDVAIKLTELYNLWTKD